MAARFDVRLHPEAAKEYQRLDNSVLPQINKAIDELSERADQVGKILGNRKTTKLAGCKEIKLRTIGIRIIFKVTDEIVNVLRIVYILTIEQRSDDFAFKVADKRLLKLKNTSKGKIPSFLDNQQKWDKD